MRVHDHSYLQNSTLLTQPLEFNTEQMEPVLFIKILQLRSQYITWSKLGYTDFRNQASL